MSDVLNCPINFNDRHRSFNSTYIPKPFFHYIEFEKWRNNLQPFAIEIGCGVGLHPILWAKENPQSQLLAIERTQSKFKKFQRRLASHPDLTNIFPAHADASHLLPQLINPQQVDQIIIFYPNPYPKKKHENLRLAFSPFTSYLSQLLKPTGQLKIATNIFSYATELRDNMHRHSLTLISEKTIDRQAPPRTHFEKKYLLRGDTCFEFIFQPTQK